MKLRNTTFFYSVVIIIVIGFIIIKFLNFKKIKEEYLFLNHSSLSKYVRLYNITQIAPLKSIDDFKLFIKERNLSFYQQIKDIDMQYLQLPENNTGVIYLKGFDNNNDSLKQSYNLSGISFWNSLIKKGDLKLSIYDYEFKKKINTIYKVVNDTITEIDKLDLIDTYLNSKGCKELQAIDRINEASMYSITFEIKKGIIKQNYTSNNISEETIKAIKMYLKHRTNLFKDDESYLIKYIGYNIENFVCKADISTN